MEKQFPILTTVILIILTLLLPFTSACMDPAGRYAVEVTLNKPGTTYNFTALREHLGEHLVVINNSTYLFKYSIRYMEPSREEVLKQLDFMVMLYEAEFSGGAPYVEGLSDPGNIEYYLGIRLELIVPLGIEVCIVETATYTSMPTVTTRSEEQYNCLTVYSDDFKRVLKDLLDILVNKWHVVSGLIGNDIAKIVEAVEPGLAGWNNRLVYSEALNTWKPYYELVVEGHISGVLVKGNACSAQVPSDAVDELKKLGPSISLNIYIAVQPPTTTTSPAGITTTPVVTPCPTISSITLDTSIPAPSTSLARNEKEFNGLVVAISLVAGTTVALIVYLVLLKRY